MWFLFKSFPFTRVEIEFENRKGEMREPRGTCLMRKDYESICLYSASHNFLVGLGLTQL